MLNACFLGVPAQTEVHPLALPGFRKIFAAIAASKVNECMLLNPEFEAIHYFNVCGGVFINKYHKLLLLYSLYVLLQFFSDIIVIMEIMC